MTTTVLRDTMAFVSLGLMVGIPLALGAGAIVRAYLFGVDAPAPVTLSPACATVLICALAAAYLPAPRAPRVDPIVALRID